MASRLTSAAAGVLAAWPRRGGPPRSRDP